MTFAMMYRVIGRQVLVYLNTDGRRDMQALLQRRLLGG
jgi:toxin ParE1/3/4